MRISPPAAPPPDAPPAAPATETDAPSSPATETDAPSSPDVYYEVAFQRLDAQMTRIDGCHGRIVHLRQDQCSVLLHEMRALHVGPPVR